MHFSPSSPDEFSRHGEPYPHAAGLGSELLVGYRVIRTLAESAHARIYLGFTGEGGLEHESRLAVLKLYSSNAQATRDRANREVAALTRVGGAHVVALIDVATTTRGHVCVILERLQRNSLAHVLATRDSVSPGEAVTILAPIAENLDAIHESGVAHRGLRSSAVLFRSNGTPVVASFGDAELFTPGLAPAALGVHPLVIADRVALADLTRHVLAHAPHAESAAILEWVDRCEREGFPDNFGRAVADQLYEIAEPVPVDFAPARVSRVGGPSRIVPVSDPVAIVVGTREAPGGARSGGPISAGLLWVARHLPPPVKGSFENVASRRDFAAVVDKLDRSRIVQALGAVRKPVWIVTGAVASALVVAALLVPTDQGDDAAQPDIDKNMSSSDPVNEIRVGAQSETEQSIHGDEPLAAARSLLVQRQQCIRDLSIVCLDGIAQQGSVAMEADVSLVRTIQAGGERTTIAHATALPIDDNFQLVLAERLGDTALIDITSGEKTAEETATASLLLMKGEAGWRIRSYLSTAGVSQQSG